MLDPTHSPARTTIGALDIADPTQLAALGFLARYRGQTAVEFRRDLKYFLAWCEQHNLPPLQATRPHLELYIRWMETHCSERTGKPWASSTIARRWTTIRLFYKFATFDELIAKDPAAHVTPPEVNRDDQKRTWLNALEYGRLVAAAKEMGPTESALVWLLGTNALRISEACQINIHEMGRDEFGYVTVSFIGKGSKPATVPLSMPVMRAVELATAGRTEGPLLLTAYGNRMNRATACRIIRRCAASAKVKTDISPHSLRRSAATILLQQGTPLREVQLLLRHASADTTAIYDRALGNSDRSATHRLASFVSGIAA